MEELDNQRCRLQESVDEVTSLRRLLSAKDATIKELRASKKTIAQELEPLGWLLRLPKRPQLLSKLSVIKPWTRLFGRDES
jgi:uncharacterized coiled-coil DUF342 family protein